MEIFKNQLLKEPKTSKFKISPAITLGPGQSITITIITQIRCKILFHAEHLHFSLWRLQSMYIKSLKQCFTHSTCSLKDSYCFLENLIKNIILLRDIISLDIKHLYWNNHFKCTRIRINTLKWVFYPIVPLIE